MNRRIKFIKTIQAGGRFTKNSI